MVKLELAKKRILVLRVSSSIENFKEKIFNRFKYPEWHWIHNRYDRCVFFGIYHIGDYLRVLWHSGPSTIFWCGGDIINLKKSRFWQYLIKRKITFHICENEVEQKTLESMGIKSEIMPMCFDDIDSIEITYRGRKNPHVYLTAHEESKYSYGIHIVHDIARLLPEVTFHIYGMNGNPLEKNIIYHGIVSNEEFNRQIQFYQAALRLNQFDGFSEILAKSVIMGQWPISVIPYQYMTYIKDLDSLIAALKNLKNKKTPNFKGRRYWLKKLSIELK